MMINECIFIHNPMSLHSILWWIPQIKNKTLARPHHNFPCTRTHHIPNPSFPPIPAGGPPPPPILEIPPNKTIPVAPPPSGAKPEASHVRQVGGFEIVQVNLFNYIYAPMATAVGGAAVVFGSEVVADELLFGGVESGTWWETIRKRRRISGTFGIPHLWERKFEGWKRSCWRQGGRVL